MLALFSRGGHIVIYRHQLIMYTDEIAKALCKKRRTGTLNKLQGRMPYSLGGAYLFYGEDSCARLQCSSLIKQGCMKHMLRAFSAETTESLCWRLATARAMRYRRW
eukprot:6194046-Pleurochrysis_carterae.AAC.1